jgi:hypothetical protein
VAIEIKRNLTGSHALQPGEYFTDPAGYIEHCTAHVTLSCPLCGGLTVLDELYAIDRAGRISPSFACPKCPLLERLVLDGWGDS